MASPVTQALFTLVDLLEALEVPYMVMGGFAVRVWGVPRPTYDVDFTLDADEATLALIYERVDALGFTVPEAFRGGFVDSIRGLAKVKLMLFGEPSPIDIDIFLAGTDYQHTALSRRISAELEERTLLFISPEDLVLHKLIAGRPRDLGDVADVLLVQGRLDVPYMLQWAQPLRVHDLLIGHLRSAGYET